MAEINIFPKFIDSALTPVATSVGNTLSSIWNIVFGEIDSYSQRLDQKRKYNLDQFRQELDDKVSAIPKDKLVEPPLHVIGPTLEASKFYFDNEDLRSMFANLIASAINIDSANNVHPSFVEIIKQLHPDEAKITRKFSKAGFPLVDVISVFDNNGLMNIAINFSDIAEKAECSFPLSIGSYIDNLSRLGLISVEMNSLINQNLYESLLVHPIIEEAKQKAILIGDKEPRIMKKLFRVTPFGLQFYRTCCVQYEQITVKQAEE